jgi:formiminoglutamate deiminase
VSARAGRWHAELAWDGDRVAAGLLIETVGDRVSAVTPGVAAAGATALPGITLPGLANAHSHAFHRALRGRTQAGRGTFWTWREQMYRVADRLTPESCFALARAVYAEMALAGVSSVGEFHYVHHGPGGSPYADPNAMGAALIAAAGEAGVRITLLDACYLTSEIGGGLGGLAGTQRRFGDGDAHRWARRVSLLDPPGHARLGAAIHSVRAVPPDQLGTVVDWAAERAAPLHVHLSEQRAENAACLAAYRRTPAQLLAEAGVWGPSATAVHATHLTDDDIAVLGASGAGVCMCPTTERDLADGIGPARLLAEAGCPITLGSDSQAVIDLFEEARAVELHERLRTEQRGHWAAAALLRAATRNGHAALGWPEAGRIAPGALADFVTVALDTPRLAGTRAATAAESVVFAATAADVRSLVVGGVQVVRDGTHLMLGDGADIAAAYEKALAEVAP